MRVLLLSAYDAGSHRYWRECLCRGISDWQWSTLVLPARHFSWRIRGNALYWSLAEREVLELDYDLVLATSMVDLATLRGLVPSLGQTPALLYFHENQFAYPANRGRHSLLEARMVSLYSALAARRLVFNSHYNLETFLHGCAEMLRAFPDKVPPAVAELLRARAGVLPVPLDRFPATGAAGAPKGRGLQLVWNHRWEYDKGPERLLAIVKGLLQTGLEFTLHVVGQQFREQPPEFAGIRALMADANALGRWGFIDDEAEYLALLQACDVVLSTALHDFQGLSLMQACAAGCSPLAPARLVYPEWLQPQCLYPAHDDVQKEAAGAVDAILALARLQAKGKSLPRVDLAKFHSDNLLPGYRDVLRAASGRPVREETSRPA